MTSRSLRTAVAAFAMAAPLVLSTSPAHAAGTGVVTGTGSISPGVPVTGCVNGASISFSGQGYLANSDGLPAGPYDVAFTGNSNTCESVATGSGIGQLSGDVAGTVTYTRATGAITLSGSVTIGGVTKSLIAVCAVVLDPVVPPFPVTDYTLACSVTLAP
jgi:hypothetical protein